MSKTYTNSSTKFSFALRLIVVYLLQLFIKAFDYSFGGVFPLTFRGMIFTFTFVSYWLTIWYVSEHIQKKISPLNTLSIVTINVLIGIYCGLSSTVIYMLGDTYLFQNGHLWEEIPFYNPELSVALCIIYLLIFTVYAYVQKIFQLKEKEVNVEQLEKEMFKSQYMSLKAQIEPHFLFNSLSVLSSIVHTDQNLASEFIIKLSKTLRYIIEQNKRVLVSLGEELKVVEDYFFLLKTRFGEAIQLQNNIDPNIIETIMIPPASIQVLVENAVKHNKLSMKKPLLITIALKENLIIVTNNYDKKEVEETSTGMGLSNINKRYQLIAGKNIIIEKNQDTFKVSLPALSTIDHENFNH
ncbi:sensor histidine kinase [Flammeovirga sp. EKP202]|uniref:sensor histidine kinase n=1 Tax=Flammeovirga sp. EKP202 TaxID=2770592 RepID=UPI0016600607|nr:histidine kinase [Flammeovirga sp. EKP202]MBD0403774.1 histidine kinase [Flammeovirga sp. EKP202]